MEAYRWRSMLQEARLTNPCDAFRGQSRTPNIVPFHMSGVVSSCAIVTSSLIHVVFPIFNFKKCMTLKSTSKVTQSHWKWYHSIDCYDFLLVFYRNFVPKMPCFWDIRLQKCCDLENWVRDPSRSLEMSPCDRAHTTSCWHSTVTMALSRVISEIFNVENVVTLK